MPGPLIEIGMSQEAVNPERFPTTEEVFESQQRLTNDYVIEKSQEIVENGGVQSLDLIEVLKLNETNLAFFDKSETFNINRLRLLRELDLSNNKLSQTLGLSYLASIEILNLNNNCISSLRGLEECTTLKTLLCNDNFVETISELRTLKDLSVLELTNNKLKNFPSIVGLLQELPKLRTLSLKANSVGLTVYPVLEINKLQA